MNQGTSELEYIRERRSILQEWLEDPKADIERVRRIQLQRELRLLDKIRAEVPEGKVLSTLQLWRSSLGEKLRVHRQQTKKQQRIVDEWYRLPDEEKQTTPKPEAPALGVEVTAASGEQYIIDDRYLATLDDLISRLEKWKGEM
jgi:hypothetical protein